MMRSLYSGVSGLKTHQTRMDVIGNNIANVNTVAYKSQSATFQDLMYQTTQSASGANEATGRAGINAKQIGLGVKAGAISTSIATAGATQSTGNPFDISISGDAFFIVSDGSSNMFTRAGTFTIDANGTLCMTTNGYAVQGWQADEEGNIIKNNVSSLRVMSAEVMTMNAESTTEAYMTGTIDSNDKQLATGQVSTVQFYDDKGYSYTMKYSITNVDSDGVTQLPDGIFRMGMSDILDASGKSILTIQNLLEKGIITETGAGKYSLGNGTELSGTYSETDTLEAVDKMTYLNALNLFSVGTDSTETVTGAANTVYAHYDKVNGTFLGISTDPADDLTDATKQNKGFAIDTNGTGMEKLIPGMADTDRIDIDMSTSKNIDNNGTSTIAGKSGMVSNTTIGAGRAAGEMDSLAVQQDGKIIATYTNGVTKILGQIAVAEFANASGLEKVGENLYAATQNSGEFDGVGVDITASGGSMASGALEMSNVDLSNEFTEMITTQRGFQANSRTITVSDTLLEELINLKR